MKKDLVITIVNFNTKDLTSKCLRSIFESHPKVDFEVWVVDNGSTDGSPEYIKEHFPQVSLIRNNKNVGFASANNQILKKIEGRYFLLLNSDTEVYKDSLDKLVDFMDRSNYGIGSCLLSSKDGRFQPNAGDLPFGIPLLFWIFGWDDIFGPLREKLPSFHRQFKSYYRDERPVGWVSGSVMIIRDEVVKKIGGMDSLIFMYGEDVDYCIRATRVGFKVGWTDQTQVMHLGGASSPASSLAQWRGEFKGLVYLYKKYYGILGEDTLKTLIYIFTFVRIIAFLVTGKYKNSQTYAKILFNL